jgi:hypothetical protein
MKDLVGNVGKDTDVIPAAVDFYVTSVSIVDENELSMEFNQDIGSCDQGAFVLKYGESTTSAAAAYISSGVIDSKNNKKLKVRIASVDNRVLTNLDGMYMHVLDNSLVKDIYGQEMTTSAGVFTGGPTTVEDKARPYESIKATTGGIIIEFSEPVTTTAEGFLSELLIVNWDNSRVTVSPSSISAIDGDLSTGFTKLLVSGLDSGTYYKVYIYGYCTTDKYGNRIRDGVAVNVRIE